MKQPRSILQQALVLLLHNVAPGRDYDADDQGNITAWRHPRKQPKPAALATAKQYVQRAQQRKVIPKLTPRQIRLFLISINVLESTVEMHIMAKAKTDKERAEGIVEWRHASFHARSHPLIDLIGDALGLTPTQIDTGFITYSTK